MTWDDDPELEDTDALAAPDYSSQQVLVEEPDDDDWAAPARPGTFAPDPASDAADDLLEEDWGPEKGFSDPTNSVRVWADPEGGLEKVRVWLSWRTRLDGRPLGEAVTVAFMLMNNYLHAYAGPSHEQLPRIATRPSSSRAAQIRSRLAEIRAELAALDPAEFPGYTEEWEPAVGTDFENGVRVQLDRTGRPAIARFDPAWLQTANSRELSLGIMTSYRKARMAYRPPVRSLDRAGELMAERRRLRNELDGPRPKKTPGGLVTAPVPPPPAVMTRRPPGHAALPSSILDPKIGDSRV